MSKGKAQAWQVREFQRQKLFDRFKQHVIMVEDDFNRADFHRMLLYAFGQLLRHDILSDVPCDLDSLHLRDIPERTKLAGVRFTLAEKTAIVAFQRSPEEGAALIAERLVWAAGEVAHPYQVDLQRQEIQKPEVIYGVQSATDEVPFE